MPHSRDVVAADEVPMLQSVALMYYVPGAVPRGEVSVVACAAAPPAAAHARALAGVNLLNSCVIRDVTIPGDLHVAWQGARARDTMPRAPASGGALARWQVAWMAARGAE